VERCSPEKTRSRVFVIDDAVKRRRTMLNLFLEKKAIPIWFLRKLLFKLNPVCLFE